MPDKAEHGSASTLSKDLSLQQSLVEKSAGISGRPGEDATTQHPGVTHSDGLEHEDGNEQSMPYPKGWRLQMANLALCSGLFLSNLETTIVSTSVVAITNALDGFHKSSWIITAYLLTYTGFLVILAKLSDIFGRKLLMSFTLIMFIAFSIAYGLAQSMTTLIIFRAFQGIGGGGINAMTFVILPEMAPTEKYALYAAIISATSALASLLGPILGGLINNHTNWKWVFLLNAPAGAVVLSLLFFALPSNFPHPPRRNFPMKDILTLKNVRRVDFLGAFLLLAASLLLVTALEEGGTEYSWQSPVTLSLLIVSLFLWPCFFIWERHLDTKETTQEPVFPWRLTMNRFAMGTLLNAFFVGSTFITVIIYLPQRFQVVYGDSPFAAGYRLLALTLSVSGGAAFAGSFVERLKIPPFYIFLCAAVLQTVGLSLMSTVSVSEQSIPPATYGYQVIMGLGFGMGLGTAVMMIPLVVEKRDMAVAMGAVGQFRMLGSSIAIAICTNVLNNQVIADLSTVLSRSQLEQLLQSAQTIATIPPASRETVKHVYAEGYNRQMQVMTAFSGAAVLATLMLWEKRPRKAL